MQSIYERRLSAEEIATALDGYRCGTSYKARCPAHNDKSPSLSLSEQNGRVLVKCWSGCSQPQVLNALRSHGLWLDKKPQQPLIAPLIDQQTLGAFIEAHERNLRRGILTSKKAQRTYRDYQRLIYAPFTAEQITAMHLFVEVFAADVKNGKTPTEKEESRFLQYLSLTKMYRVPYGF